jgi:3-oxoacyl-[acyl-carrier-protein] synthase II
MDFVPNTSRSATVSCAQNDGFAFGGNNAITIFGVVE